MRIALLVIPLSILCSPTYSAGALDFLVPCKGAEQKFKSTTDAIHSRVSAATSKLAA